MQPGKEDLYCHYNADCSGWEASGQVVGKEEEPSVYCYTACAWKARFCLIQTKVTTPERCAAHDAPLLRVCSAAA